MTDTAGRLQDLPEFNNPALSIEEMMAGRGLRFQVGETWYELRQPSPEEVAEAESVQRAAKLRRSLDADMQALAAQPPTPAQQAGVEGMISLYERALEAPGAAEMLSEDQRRHLERRVNGLYRMLEQRTAADSLLNEFSAEIRDLWLARRLLCDGQGQALDFDRQPATVREEAQAQARTLLQAIDTVPFSWVLRLAARSTSTGTSSAGPSPDG